jgi:NAD+ kinase
MQSAEIQRLLIYGQHIKSTEEYSYVLNLIDALQAHGYSYAFYEPFAAEIARFGTITTTQTLLQTHDQLLQFAPDAAIVLGGDGTILRSVTLIRDSNIPILGINLGRLGFLASVEKTLIPKAIYKLKHGLFTLVNRSLLQLKSNFPLFEDFAFGLNDFTVNRRDTSSMITVYVSIDGIPLHAYWADGLIISTPTGSTGYSLSCGGPILFPDASNFIITPVAPHNLTVRPVVIPDDKLISLRVEGRQDSFMCTLDSRYETFGRSHVIEITKASFSIRFIQLEGQNFMHTLGEKLLWGRDKRN